MTTTKPQVKIVNVETGEEIVRDATTAELAQMKLDAENAAKQLEEAAAKDAAREALLNRLGITADEAKLLLA
jgi:hypothetical protein